MARLRLLSLVVVLLLAGCTGPDAGPGATVEGDGPGDAAEGNATGDTTVPTDASNGTLNGSVEDVALLDARPMRAQVNVSAGHNVSVLVSVGVLTNEAGAAAGDDAATVAVVLEEPTGRMRGGTFADLGVEDATAVLVPVDVPADAAPGNYTLALRVFSARQGILLHSTETAVTVRVLDPAGAVDGFGPEHAAQVLYVGRLAETDAVFNTNDPVLQQAGYFDRTDDYSASSGTLPVREGAVIEGFFEGMQGMRPGESRRITFPAEDGYGPAWWNETVARETVLERDFVLDVVTQEVARDAFEEFIRSSGQGAPEDYGVNDTFVFEQGGNAWVYGIEALDNETVTYRIRLAQGETYTIYPFWTNGTVVASLNETAAVLRTTPTGDVDRTFTFHSEWPGMSRVTLVNETSIVVLHEPPEGLDYSKPNRMGQTDLYRLVAVEEDVIRVQRMNTHALAGHALTFDVLLLDLVDA